MNAVSRRVSSFSFLLLMFAAVVVPLLSFGGYLFWRYTDMEQQRYQREALVAARQVTAALDQELEALLSTLRALSTAGSLREGRLADFHRQTRHLARLTGYTVILRSTDGQKVLDSSHPFDNVGPIKDILPESELAAITAGSRTVTGVFESPALVGPAFAVYLKVADSSGHLRLLGIRVTTRQLLDAISPSIPPGWLVGVGDKNNRYVLRSVDHEKWSGAPTLPEYTAHAVDSEGVFRSINVEGRYLLAGYTYSEISGWLVSANVPVERVQAPLHASIVLFTATGLLALLLSGALAVLVGRRLTTSMSDLAAKALSVGRGEVVTPSRSFLRELELAGRALSRASRDLAERSREREEAIQRQQLLMNELNHRVKNTLASVQAMVSQTMRSARSIPQAREAITSRLIALARAQDVLTRESWEGADLDHVVRAALEPHDPGGRSITIDGPPVRLSPRATLAISLALHELATNAVKYGALVTPDGTVTIKWTVTSQDPRRFVMTWIEADGPPVVMPEAQGFGTRLIQKGLGEELFADVAVEYRPGGLVFRMETDLANVEDVVQAAA